MIEHEDVALPAPAVERHLADTIGNIAAEAWKRNVAKPRVIHVRPEVRARIVAQERQRGLDEDLVPLAGQIGVLTGIPIVVDPSLPLYPGFEVRRERPSGWTTEHEERS